MFALRTTCSRLPLSLAARRFTTQPTKQSPSWPLYFAVAGAAGLGGWAYLTWNDQPAAKPKPIQEKSPLDPEKFINFKLKTVVPYNHNTSKFVFELPENQASLLPVASCVVVKAADESQLLDAKGKPIIRPYTPISPSDAAGEFVFLIKKYDKGNASKHIHSLKEGDSLAIKGPIKKWDYKINEFDEVALIGGGSGITPLYQILTYALPNKENKTKFKLIFANVTEADILLREEFDAMKKAHPNTFDVIYTLDKPAKDWTGYSGFVNKDLLSSQLAPASQGNKVKVFICGPPGQVAAIAGKKEGMKQGELGGILKELGYTSEQVFKF